MNNQIKNFQEYEQFLLNSLIFLEFDKVNKEKNIGFITEQLEILNEYYEKGKEFEDLLKYYFNNFCYRSSYKMINKEFWKQEKVIEKIEMNFFKKLVEKTNIAEMCDKRYGYSMLKKAIFECYDEEDAKFVELLIANGADLYLKDNITDNKTINYLEQKIKTIDSDGNNNNFWAKQKAKKILLSVFSSIQEKEKFECKLNEINSKSEDSNSNIDELGIDVLDILNYNENDQSYLWEINNVNENQKDFKNKTLKNSEKSISLKM